MLGKFAAITRGDAHKEASGIVEEVSVNPDSRVDTGALLQGDADEELRQADRLAEKATNAKEGKMPRVTVNDIRPSQRIPGDSKDESS